MLTKAQNWFQNRRAREKKEKNIREYAAKQKVEKDHVSPEAGDSTTNDRHKELVASSAPFPVIRRPSKATTDSSDLPSDLHTPGHESETTDASQYDDLAIYSSPEVSIQETPNDSLILKDAGSVKLEYLSPQNEEDSKDGFVSDHSSEFFRAQSDELSLTNSESFGDRHFYGQFPQLIVHNEEGETTPSISACFNEHMAMHAQDAHYQLNSLSMGMVPSQVSAPSQMTLKSPPSIDIASRRNRRPPHLAINASRSFSSGFPRTGIEMGRRGSNCGSMRRVASATGAGRICKSASTPRSPFFERNSDALFQLNRSPSFIGTSTTAAPPTPNTPVVVNSHNNNIGEVTPASSLTMEDKYSSMLAVHDPTLRTPPTTPGIIDAMFNMDTAYDMPVSDEPLITPGVGHFPSDFEMPGMSNNVPDYISSGCSSQPQTPSCVPQIGPAYFGYSGGNPEYNWSDASLSADSSPSQSQRQVQFMNMTPSSFTHVER